MNADVKKLCQDQKKLKKKHKIEATDVTKHTSKIKKNKSERLELFIADVKLLCQWYRKMKKNPKN